MSFNNNIPATWVPISSLQAINENFVSGSDTTNVVENIFIVLGAVVIAIILTILFYVSYHKNKNLFISLLMGIIFLYSLMNIIGIIVIRSSLNTTFFKVYLGAGTVIGFITVILLIIFSVIASKEINRGSRDSAAYIPSNVANDGSYAQ